MYKRKYCFALIIHILNKTPVLQISKIHIKLEQNALNYGQICILIIQYMDCARVQGVKQGLFLSFDNL